MKLPKSLRINNTHGKRAPNPGRSEAICWRHAGHYPVDCPGCFSGGPDVRPGVTTEGAASPEGRTLLSADSPTFGIGNRGGDGPAGVAVPCIVARARGTYYNRLACLHLARLIVPWLDDRALGRRSRLEHWFNGGRLGPSGKGEVN